VPDSEVAHEVKAVNILVVEDDEDVRRLLETALSERFQVASVATGREAAHALLLQRPDIVLADLEVPGLCGEALALRARALNDPPAVYLMSGDHERLRAAERLAEETFSKPFSVFGVVDALSRCAALA
jgi:DNA-binding response OmpR family regulator